MKILEPKTEEEFEEYYELRWQVLRKPWGKPRGSERDDIEDKSIHIMVKNDNILGVGRLHFNSNKEAQIRYMAVSAAHRKQGIGTMILKKLEEMARKKGAKYVVLNAREHAIGFYKKNGYRIVEKSYILFGSIQHFKMMKEL